MVQEREYHEVTGDIICPSMVMGIDHIRDPRLNKVHFQISYICKEEYLLSHLVL
jgi:hypothetical protein